MYLYEDRIRAVKLYFKRRRYEPYSLIWHGARL
jgi:hypothetical protein